LFVSAAVVVVGQRVLGGNPLELSVCVFFFLFSLLCIAFLALRMCGEVKLSSAVFESNNSNTRQMGGKSECEVAFVLLDYQIVQPVNLQA